MATVLIVHGGHGDGLDNPQPARAFFQLIDGKLHLPTIRDYFKLVNVRLNNIVHATDPEGFTYDTFAPNEQIRVTGDPMPVSRQTRILLVKITEVYVEGDKGKRRVTQSEENMGLWTLPPPEAQPRTLAELTSVLKSFLQIDHAVHWLFKYRYYGELVPILSDSSLQDAVAHFRESTQQHSDDDSSSSQGCKLYLSTVSEEMAPREMIRARITGLLDAAVAQASTRDNHNNSNHLAGVPGAMSATMGPPGGEALPDMKPPMGHLGGPFSAPHLAGMLQHDSGSDGQGGGHNGSPGGSGRGNGAAVIKKESKTRHADGRFKNDAQHQRKMADMSRKIAELFEGTITNMVEVVDHKKIRCNMCQHVCTAYSAYHTDCVRKHFLRHHEPMLKERGVDVAKWRKEYELSNKLRKQQGGTGSSMGLNMLGDGPSRTGSLQAPLATSVSTQLGLAGMDLQHQLSSGNHDVLQNLGLSVIIANMHTQPGPSPGDGTGPGVSMVRMASGTVTTEIAQPPQPPNPPPPPPPPFSVSVLPPVTLQQSVELPPGMGNVLPPGPPSSSALPLGITPVVTTDTAGRMPSTAL